MTGKKEKTELSVPISISMNPKRREWWHSQPNGTRSEKVGKLIDREIAKEKRKSGKVGR